MKAISGFSKLSKVEKIDFLVDECLDNSKNKKEIIKSFWQKDLKTQKILDDFSENTITNFVFPYGVAPNVLINNELFCVPMVIEESSVVAAAARSAKFWLSRGGFKAEVLGTEKVGQVHFLWFGKAKNIFSFFNKVKKELLVELTPLTKSMDQRGGGIIDLSLIDRTCDEAGYYQLYVTFNTCDAMGANFINSVLEALAAEFKAKAENYFSNSECSKEAQVQIIMAILSNYTPNCLVKTWVSCPIEDLADPAHGMTATEFAEKISRAVRIAKIDRNRATTHNKGIFNGIDSVILATGNDFRAIEACGHTYATRNGKYEGLTDCEIKDGQFLFSLELPLSLGTVGGLTALHPMAKMSLEMLNYPNAEKLMQITATIGLAQNFAALRSLVTSGIQKGHMKMHLMNILNHLEANDHERELAQKKFKNEVISFCLVREFLASIRKYQ